MMSKTILDVLTLGDLMVDFTPAGIHQKGICFMNAILVGRRPMWQ